MEKSILLTGVSGGIGFAVAKAFINKGYRVFGLDIKEPSELVEGLSFIKTDITKMGEIESAFNLVKESGCTLKCIISTAGIYDLNSLIEMNEEEFIRIFCMVNLQAA